MIDLIDRCDLLEKMCNGCGYCDKHLHLFNCRKCNVYELISEQPTIEPEVRRGRWIVRGQEVYCSECNEESLYTPFGASKFSRFCPHCGARMEV